MYLTWLIYDETAPTLKTTALVQYPVYDFFLSVSARNSCRLIGIGRTLVVLLSVFCTQEPVEEEGSGKDGVSSVYEFTSSNMVQLKSFI